MNLSNLSPIEQFDAIVKAIRPYRTLNATSPQDIGEFSFRITNHFILDGVRIKVDNYFSIITEDEIRLEVVVNGNDLMSVEEYFECMDHALQYANQPCLDQYREWILNA